MKSFILSTILALSLFASQGTENPTFNYKDASDFKPLSEFKSVDEFEKNFKKYIQHCLDSTNGGLGGIKCLIASNIWDRELNIIYKKLMDTLPKELQSKLRDSQREWIKVRDESEEFTDSLTKDAYSGMQGTMYDLMESQDSDDFLSKEIKNRVLFLKDAYTYYKNNSTSK